MKIRDKIFIFFILVFSSGYAFGWNNAHADTVIDFNTEFTYAGRNYHMICYSEGNYGPSNVFIKPFAIAHYNNDLIQEIEFYGNNVNMTSGTIANQIYNNYNNKGCWTSNNSTICAKFFENWSDIPLFRSDLLGTYDDNAKNYGKGLEFDSSYIVAGQANSWGVDNSVVYNIVPNGFDYSFRFASDTGIVNKNGTFFIRWKENTTIPDTVHRILRFNITYPSKSWLQNYASLKLGAGTLINNDIVTSISSTMFAIGLSAIQDVDGMNQITSDVTFDVDLIRTLSGYSDNVKFVQNNNEYSLLVTEFIADNTITNTSVMSGGIVDELIDYYGDKSLAFYALPFLNFNYVDCYCIDSNSYKVFNNLNTYYMDLRKSDGTIFYTRGFDTQNTIEDSDITPNNGTPISTNVPDVNIPPSERSTTYNQGIQDSYNNITNNYYYNNTYNQNLLDYLNRFSNGGQQEDIENAFGYLNSTIDSLSNVPLLIGKLFNGFFPSAVILLLSAIFIIFCVFLLIRIIRHLFL